MNTTILSHYPLLILVAPLVAGLVINPLGGLIGKKVSRIGVLAEVFAFGIALYLLYHVVARGPQIVDFSPFAPPWNGIFKFAFYIDRLAAVMMVHITAISILIHLFSTRYMQQEHGYARFHSLLALTTFVLLGMVASADLLMLFVFWQLLSWLLSFLSYNYSDPATVRGAFRTFIMLRFGDIAFLLGIVLAYNLYGTLDLQQLFVRSSEANGSYSLWPRWGLEINATTAITLLIFVGAMSKSAQVPIALWLPDSLYAPTPVHALLHAGIINAGGFLLARLAPLYDLSPTTLHVVFAVGLLTTILGSSMMLTQNDIKKTLGYSTIGQMGFMIMECGLGAYALAIFHLIAHGIFKATIFLNCGQVIHAARQEPRSPFKEGEAADQHRIFRPGMAHRIHHDFDPAPDYPAGRPWPPAHPVERVSGRGDISFFWLGHFLPGDPDTLSFASHRLLEGRDDHAVHPVPGRGDLPSGSGKFYSLFVSKPG